MKLEINTETKVLTIKEEVLIQDLLGILIQLNINPKEWKIEIEQKPAPICSSPIIISSPIYHPPYNPYKPFEVTCEYGNLTIESNSAMNVEPESILTVGSGSWGSLSTGVGASISAHTTNERTDCTRVKPKYFTYTYTF
jgi:hypothetical protein